MTIMDHVGLCPSDMDASLRFYRDGIGLDVLFDVALPGDFEPFLGAPSTSLRTIFLGDPARPTVGVLELLELRDHDTPAGSPAPGVPHRGLCLVSFHVDVLQTLARLADLGLGGTPRFLAGPKRDSAAIVVDPDGVMVELLGQPVSVGS